jgi:proline dehydrogenase
MSNRIDAIADKNQSIKKNIQEQNEPIKEFVELGNFIFNSEEGQRFLQLAKKLFIVPNRKMRDDINTTNDVVLGRLNGEDYILRNIVSKFIKGE